MNREILNKVTLNIEKGKLSEAILILETELDKYKETKFHIIKNLDLLHLKHDLEIYIEQFINQNSKLNFQAIYCEMNGFTINHRLWYLDFFGYDFIEPIGEKTPVWLSKWIVKSDNRDPFVIKGYEVLQEIYKEYMDEELWEDNQLEEIVDICSYLIILRLQELFKESVNNGLMYKKKSNDIPIFVTAHDYECIYRIN